MKNRTIKKVITLFLSLSCLFACFIPIFAQTPRSDDSEEPPTTSFLDISQAAILLTHPSSLRIHYEVHVRILDSCVEPVSVDVLIQRRPAASTDANDWEDTILGSYASANPILTHDIDIDETKIATPANKVYRAIVTVTGPSEVLTFTVYEAGYTPPELA